MPTSTIDSMVDAHENRKHALIAVGFPGDFKWRPIIQGKVWRPHPLGRVVPIALEGIDGLGKTPRHTKIFKR